MSNAIDIRNALDWLYENADEDGGPLGKAGPYFFEDVVLTLQSPPQAVKELLKEMERSGDAEEGPHEGKRAYWFTENGLGALYDKVKKGPVQRTID